MINFLFSTVFPPGASKPPEAAVSQRGAEGTPFFFLLPLLEAMVNGRRRRPKRGAHGAIPPAGEGNSAEGGYFAS